MPVFLMLVVLAIIWWIELKKEVVAKDKANNEIEDTHIRVETLADSQSACQWMDAHISYCRENRIHCEEDKQCCCEKCDEARYLKEHATRPAQCNICGTIRVFTASDVWWNDHIQACREGYAKYSKLSAEEIKMLTTIPDQQPTKGSRLEHNGSKWTLVHADYNADGLLRFREEPMVLKPTNIPIGRKKCIHCAVPLHFKRQSDVCINCRRKQLFGPQTVEGSALGSYDRLEEIVRTKPQHCAHCPTPLTRFDSGVCPKCSAGIEESKADYAARCSRDNIRRA
jgi:hypothetical protein